MSDRYDIVVLPVTLKAESADDARNEFVRLLFRDPDRIRVSEAHEDIYAEGHDAIGT